MVGKSLDEEKLEEIKGELLDHDIAEVKLNELKKVDNFQRFDLKFVMQLRKAHNNIGNLVSSISKYSQTLELCLVSSLSKFGAQC